LSCWTADGFLYADQSDFEATSPGGSIRFGEFFDCHEPANCNRFPNIVTRDEATFFSKRKEKVSGLEEDSDGVAGDPPILAIGQIIGDPSEGRSNGRQPCEQWHDPSKHTATS